MISLTDWRSATLGAVLARQRDERGSAEAVITDTARIDYIELAARALTIARSLLAIGIGRGDHVGVLMGNDEHWLAVFYAAASIGAVTVPVNTRFKASELSFCLKQADCRALVMNERFLNIDFVQYLRDAEPAIDTALPGAALPKLANVIVIGSNISRGALSWPAFLVLGESVDDMVLSRAMQAIEPSDPLLIQFTSGTTAYPKGVLLTHDNMLRNAHAAGMRIGVRADDRYFNCRPFFHVGGSTLSALVALVFGCTLVTLPTFEAGAALAIMTRERCTLTSGNDTIFQMMMTHPTFDRARLSLRGGWAAAGPETMRNIIELMGAAEICAAYGLSEASPNVVMSDWRDPPELRIAGLATTHPGLAIRIADPTSNEALGVAVAGEIQVRGWSVMREYYGNATATAQAFSPDGWLKTGDLGILNADQRLQMVGRLKDVFRVGGENVAPAEVEEVLLSHPAIATAQVIGVPDARLGEVAAAFVTLRSGQTLEESALIDWMRARVANFRVPRYARVVENFDVIGMTASGKVQKTKLRAHALQLWRLGG